MWYCIFFMCLIGQTVFGSIEYMATLGIDASTYKMVAFDGVVNSSYITTLSGSVPATNNAANLIKNGFSSLWITRFNRNDGSLDTGFSGVGYFDLNKNNITGTGLDFSSEYEDEILFVPGAIVTDGSNYYVFASARKLSASGGGASKIFMTKITSSGSIDSSFNSGGSKDITDSILTTVYGNPSDNNALYTINAVSTDGTYAYIIGSILDDSTSSGTASKKKSFIGSINLSTGAWVTQTAKNPIMYFSSAWSQGTNTQNIIIIFDTSNDVELLGLTYDGSNTLYACGYQNASVNPVIMKFTLSSGIITLSGTTIITANTSTKAWDIKILGSNLYIAATDTSTGMPPQKMYVYSYTTSLGTNNGFNGGSRKTCTFAPYGNNPNLVQNEYLRLTVDTDQNLLYVCGSISSYSTSFVYKLDSSGTEQNFAYSAAGSGTDIYGFSYGKPVPSPILYINQASTFTSSLNSVFKAIFDNSGSTNRLFVFGASGSVTKSPGSDSWSAYSSSFDYVFNINLDVDISDIEFHHPVWCSASVSINLQNSYIPNGQSNIDVQTHANLTVIDGPSLEGMILTSRTLNISQPNTQGNLELFGMVDLTENSITTSVPLKGYIPVSVHSDATLSTIGTGKLYGSYNNGYIVITVSSMAGHTEAEATGGGGPTEITVIKNGILNITNTYSSSSAAITGHANPDIISIDGDDSFDETTTISLSAPTINKTLYKNGLQYILISTTATIDSYPEIEIPLNGLLTVQINQNFTVKTPPQGFILQGSITIDTLTIYLKIFVHTINVNGVSL